MLPRLLASNYCGSNAGDILATVENLLQSSTELAIVADDLDGRIVLWNEGARRLYGYEPEEVLGSASWFRLFPPEEIASGRAREARNEALQEKRWRGSVVQLAKGGRQFSARLTLTPWSNEGAKPAGLLSIAEDVSSETHPTYTEARVGELLEAAPAVGDITSHKRADVESRAQVQILDRVSDSIMVRTLDDTITYWNRSAERLYGWSRQEAIGRHAGDLFHSDSPKPLEEIRSTLLRDGYWEGELERKRCDGKSIVAYSRWMVRRDENGNPVDYLEIDSDATVRKQLERALLEKTLELKKAQGAKDRFLRTLSDELQTPLKAIVGFTGTLLMRLPGPLTHDQERQLRTVQDSARQQLALIDDLLALAKIETGKVALTHEAIDCQSLVQSIVAALRPQAEAKRLRLETHLPMHDVVVRSDRRALSQILLNLVENAIAFTEVGGVDVELVRVEPSGRKRTEFRIVDSGIGIRTEDRSKLFEAFATIDAGKQRREGSGLGLHLSKKMAEVLGGTIAFESEFGRGSTFSLILEEA